VLADDHNLVRDGLRRILTAEKDLRVVAEAESAAETLRALETHRPDVLILDISLPDRSGLDLLSALKPHLKKTHVLMLTMHPERLFAIRAIQAGASGYMTKESAADQLVGAVRKISRGGRYVTPEVADALAEAVSKRGASPRPSVETLSARELEVLRHIASGEKPASISKRLSLSVSSIQTYRTRLLEKLRLKTTSDLIRYAIEKKLVE
jgi:DNA-binding NarL/FixJ family response regulator